MVWIISGLLCVSLLVAILAIVFPEVVLPFFAKIWEKQFYYWK